jgi:hypothetical protein
MHGGLALARQASNDRWEKAHGPAMGNEAGPDRDSMNLLYAILL